MESHSINFAAPQFLWLLGLLPLWLAMSRYAQKRYEIRLGQLLPRYSLTAGKTYLVSLVLLVAGASCLIVAMARPRWRYAWETVKHRGNDLVVALDVSRSMLAGDLKPSRLEQAKRAIRDLLRIAQGDRVGLVLFSGKAYIHCPLTRDMQTLELFLDSVDTEAVPTGGTSFRDALAKSLASLEQGSEGGGLRGKAILLISDGEDHAGDLEAIEERLVDQGVKVYGLALGGEGAPIPLSEGGFLKDSRGQVVITRGEGRILERLAQRTGAQVLRAREGGVDLESLYRSELKRGARESLTEERQKRWQEEHMWFSLAGGLLFFGEWLLRRHRRGLA